MWRTTGSPRLDVEDTLLASGSRRLPHARTGATALDMIARGALDFAQLDVGLIGKKHVIDYGAGKAADHLGGQAAPVEASFTGGDAGAAARLRQCCGHG